MIRKFTNINTAEWTKETTPRGGTWEHLDLDCDHIGVRLECLLPGADSSMHHFHTAEEEHVLVLEGEATLILGDEEFNLGAGDHVFFPAGKEEAHHIKNQSNGEFKFLVFGERKVDDVVFYPQHKVAMYKGLGWKKFKYQEIVED